MWTLLGRGRDKAGFRSFDVFWLMLMTEFLRFLRFRMHRWISALVKLLELYENLKDNLNMRRIHLINTRFLGRVISNVIAITDRWISWYLNRFSAQPECPTGSDVGSFYRARIKSGKTHHNNVVSFSRFGSGGGGGDKENVFCGKMMKCCCCLRVSEWVGGGE